MSNETKHTREPWALEKSPFEVYNVDHGALRFEIVSGTTLIAAMYDSPENANARRIVACVNACRGLPTKELEEKGLVSAVGTVIGELEAQLAAKPLNRELNQLVEDNNRLEAQLEKLSGKTGYCTECERLGRENKELREAGIAWLDADSEDALFDAMELMEISLGRKDKALSGG